MPAIVADGWPNLLEKTINLIFLLFFISAKIISLLLSVEGSKAKIISYYPSSLGFINLLNIKLKNILLKNSIDYLYNKFGVTECVRPKLKTNYKTNIYFKNKNSIQNFKNKKILIGDLMYDEFLRSNNKITINLDDKDFSKQIRKNYLDKSI